MSRINRSALRKARQQIKEAAKEGNEEAQERISKRGERKAERRAASREVGPQRPKTKMTYNFAAGQLVRITGKHANRYGATPEEAYLVIGVSNTESQRGVQENYWIDITGPVGLITVRASALRNF